FIGNFQEASGVKTGWGAVILAEAVSLIAASTVHRVCITTCHGEARVVDLNLRLPFDKF
ncbi:hypothetical protein Goshw_009695, partial [Gossypium schwendimanii]|nr:hypothetical protein [Gossypium schwendimanii]